MSETLRCAECGKPIYWTAEKDKVGRQTSITHLRHWDHEANEDHEARQ